MAPMVPPITCPISPPPAGGEPVPPCARIPITSPYHETRNDVVASHRSLWTRFQVPRFGGSQPPGCPPGSESGLERPLERGEADRPLEPRRDAAVAPDDEEPGLRGEVEPLQRLAQPLVGVVVLVDLLVDELHPVAVLRLHLERDVDDGAADARLA